MWHLSFSISFISLLSLLFLRHSHFSYNKQVWLGQWFSPLPGPGTPLEGWLMMIMIMMMKRLSVLTLETTMLFQDTASAMNNIPVTTHALFFLHLHVLTHRHIRAANLRRVSTHPCAGMLDTQTREYTFKFSKEPKPHLIQISLPQLLSSNQSSNCTPRPLLN